MAIEGEVDWIAVWMDTAARLRAFRASGQGHLLNEEVLRRSAIEELIDRGVAPERLAMEVFAPELRGGKLDLVVDGLVGTVVEFKYPRDSRTGTSPDTMTLSELLTDFVRVDEVPSESGWVVQAIGPRLAGFLSRRSELDWTVIPGSDFVLTADAIARLPETAKTRPPIRGALTARCRVYEPIDEGLALIAYELRREPYGNGQRPRDNHALGGTS